MKAAYFFNDHQNAIERLLLAKKLGFKHLIFEDNYPLGRGDCFSIKQALMEATNVYEHDKLSYIESLRGKDNNDRINKRIGDAYDLIDIYFEFRPLFKTE